jgi:hypothetical protein
MLDIHPPAPKNFNLNAQIGDDQSPQYGWPLPATKSYMLTRHDGSYSFFAQTLALPELSIDTVLAQRVSEVYEALLQSQEPLGRDIEALWEANLTSLYEP